MRATAAIDSRTVKDDRVITAESGLMGASSFFIRGAFRPRDSVERTRGREGVREKEGKERKNGRYREIKVAGDKDSLAVAKSNVLSSASDEIPCYL